MAAAAIHFQILHNKGLPHIPPLIAAIVWEITMRKNLIYFKQIWSDSYKTNLTFFISTVKSQLQLADKRVFEHTYSEHIPLPLRQSGICYILKNPFYPVASLREVFQ